MFLRTLGRCFSKLSCHKKQKEVYVLALSENKVYVGESDDPDKRVWVHSHKNGSAWTKKYNVIKRLQTKTKKQTYMWELIETLEWMKEVGIDNVRGSMFTKPFPLSKQEKIMAAQLYCELHNLCRKCGGEGHFVNQCPNKGVEDWVHMFGGYLQETKSNKRVCILCNCNIQNLPSNYRYCIHCFKKEHYG
jgi:predicted GIY-YIG superfamily endonuclease